MSRSLVSWLILMGLAIALVAVLQGQMDPVSKITLSDFWALVRDKQITELVIKDDGIVQGRRTSIEGDAAGTTGKFEVLFPREAIDGDFLNRMMEQLPDAVVKAERPSQFMLILMSTLPWILIFGFIWFFIFRQMRGAGGPGGMLGNFGRSKHRLTPKEHTGITFSDVAGIEEAKEEERVEREADDRWARGCRDRNWGVG